MKTKNRQIVETAINFGKTLSKDQRENLLALCDECRQLGAARNHLAPIYCALLCSMDLTAADLAWGDSVFEKF